MPILKIAKLKQKPNYFDKVISLIEKSYLYKQGNSYFVDFYPLMKRENWENCHLLLKDDGALIGHIGVKPRIISINNVEYKCAFIGGIAIDPIYRNMGFFKFAFERIIETLKDKYSYAFLWSDNTNLYQKFGFSVVSECSLYVSELNAQSFLIENNYQQTKLSLLTNDEKKQIKYLYKTQIYEKKITPFRTNIDWLDIEKIKSMSLYVKKIDRQIIAYCFLGKGQDYENIIHEFAVSPRHIREEELIKSLSIIVPDEEHLEKNEMCIRIPTALSLTLKKDEEFRNKIHSQTFIILGADSI
tara:strand:+ start:60 stop:959 length:900 start_codon:yes stop_codon:yes gene_type:complete